MSMTSLAAISSIDIKQGMANCMEDEELYISIMQMYVNQLVENLPQLSQANSDQNWQDLGRLAHSIKGASASVGAIEVQSLAATLEKAAKQDEVATITDNIDNFIALVEDTKNKIQQAL